MGNEKVDVLSFQAGFTKHLLGNIRHRSHGNLENLVSLHLEEVIATRDRLCREASLRATARRVKLLLVSTIRFDSRGENSAIFFNRAENRRARAISKQHAGRAIRLI